MTRAKFILLLTLVFLLMLSAAGRVVFAAGASSVDVEIDSNKQVTISGFISAGPGHAVAIQVIDPTGKVDYLNSVVSEGLGNYRASYTMPSVTPGTYQVMVNTLTETSPITTSFTYGVNNDLGSLCLSRGGLDKAFSPSMTTYAASFDSRIDKITVTPTVSDSTATVKVNGTAVTSGQPSAEIQLMTGTNTISVVVTALTGKTKTYTITVTKAGAIVTDMEASAGIDSNKKVTVNGTIDAGPGQWVSVKITDPKGNTEYIGNTLSTGSGQFHLSYDLTNTVNGRYTVTVGALGVSTPVTTYFDYTELTNLVLSDIILSPAFNSNMAFYTATAGDSVSSTKVTPTSGDSAAKITVNSFTVASGTASGSIALDKPISTINVIVTGQDGVSSRTYVVTIAKNIEVKLDGSTDATIDKNRLVVISGRVGTKEKLPVSVLITDPAGKTEYVGTAETGAAGAFRFAYTLTNETRGTYNVTVGAVGIERPITTSFIYHPELSNLQLTGSYLSPAFSPEVTGYSAYVGHYTSSVRVTPTVSNPLSTIKVNGVSVKSGATSGNISLSEGQNAIQVVVTTIDGIEKAYTISVWRDYAPPPLSNNANLSSLGLSSGSLSPSFAAGTTSYAVSVENGVSSLTVTPCVANSYASVKVNNAAVASGTASGPISLQIGVNTITVVVRAEDGSTKTYTLTVTRAQSSNANLSSLAIWPGALSPEFASGTTDYIVNYSNNVDSMRIVPRVENSSATVTVNGVAVASGSPSDYISLQVGVNTISIVVTAEDGSTQTYTITVNRALSSNANLSGLAISQGLLTPSFAAGTTNYTVSVANSVSQLTVRPTVADSLATVTVNDAVVASGSHSAPIDLVMGDNTITVVVTAENGNTQTYTVTVTRVAVGFDYTVSIASGINGGNITANPTSAPAGTIINLTIVPLSATMRLIPGSLKYHDGTTYHTIAGTSFSMPESDVTVTAEFEPILSSDATLGSLTIKNGDLELSLSPVFAAATTSYTVSVENEVGSLSVYPIPNFNGTVTVNGQPASEVNPISLSVGENTITIEVTAENGTTKKTYTITVTRAAL